MSRRAYSGSLLLGALGAMAGCVSQSAYDELKTQVDGLAEVTAQQSATIARITSQNETFLGFFNDYRMRLDTTPENLANHEFEEAIRYASIRVELLTIRRQLNDERRLRETGDTAAIDTCTRNTEAKLADLERTLRGYVDTETAARTAADTQVGATAAQALGNTNTTVQQLGQTAQDLQRRLDRAEAALTELRQAEERRALERMNRR